MALVKIELIPDELVREDEIDTVLDNSEEFFREYLSDEIDRCARCTTRKLSRYSGIVDYCVMSAQLQAYNFGRGLRSMIPLVCACSKSKLEEIIVIRGVNKILAFVKYSDMHPTLFECAFRENIGIELTGA